MLLNKVSEIKQKEIDHLYNEFVKKYPECDDDNNLPDNSNILELIVSPFDHWLTWEEAQTEIRGFTENPTNEMLNNFRQNEEKNLRFISQYLKSRQFFFVDITCLQLHENGEYQYKNIFYTCDSETNFYKEIQNSYIFLPAINIFMDVHDDYSIRFELLKTPQSDKEMTNIIELAEENNLFIN